MAFKLNHVHLKTPDPQKTANWYVDNLGAKIVPGSGPDSVRLDLHGLQLNVTRFIEHQTRRQFYGMEHLAIDTDDLDNVVEKLKASGASMMEEATLPGGRRVFFFEGPDGVQLEVLETVK